MGKKKKEKSSLRFSSSNEFCSLQDEVIQHLPLLKESKGLVIGFNATIRSIEKDILSAIIYVSNKGVSALYHALNLKCKSKDVLFLRVQDINSNVFSSKVPSSTTYGIKKCALEQPQFSKLLEKINNAKKARKNQKEKNVETLLLNSEEFCEEMKSEAHPGVIKEFCDENEELIKDIPNETFSKDTSFIHPKHEHSKCKYTGKEGMLNFQEIDFPDYKSVFKQLSVSIK